MTAKRTNTDQYLLRLPPGLRERIKEVADAYGRSLNAEIIMTLEQSYPDMDRPSFREHVEQMPDDLAKELSFLDEIENIGRRLAMMKEEKLQDTLQRARQEAKQVGKAIDRADELLKKPKK